MSNYPEDIRKWDSHPSSPFHPEPEPYSPDEPAFEPWEVDLLEAIAAEHTNSETGMTIYYVTFGQQYRHEPHPTLGLVPSLPDYVVQVEAPDSDAARALVVQHLGQSWSFLYRGTGDPKWYPRGPYARITDQGIEVFES